MKRPLVSALLIVLPLTSVGCDEQQVKAALTQCMLAKEAHRPGGGWDDDYLSLCMQAKGFVIDEQLTWGGVKCDELPYPAISGSCYRSDNWFGKIAARLRR